MRLLLLASCSACLLALAPGSTAGSATGERWVQVVVLLDAPSLAAATAPRARAEARIAAEQRRFTQALRSSVPGSSVRWRYRLVANGAAVLVPRRSVARLSSLPGVREVVEGARYRVALDRTPRQIGARALWEPSLQNAGQGMKIGIIDDGVDQRHRFFDPAGYTMPAGFPKGRTSYTTAKVIVARAFPPPGTTWKNAAQPFDRSQSEHGTHVAGIAAGNANTGATEGRRVSGIAPRAYIGNYKALTVPTDSGVGLDGNAAELVAAIEAAVADGMDVINLSIGEPEVEPSRDLVAGALDAAADLGVVPVVAAGNDFGEFGRGSVTSPGSSARAITVAAATSTGSAEERAVADFSGSGPSTLSLRLKPDVAAPGVGVLSSVPAGWATISGTSMAAPYVAGGAALLRQRHPDWTVDQVKSALVGTARPIRDREGRPEPAAPTRVGGGLIDLAAADRPLVLAEPAGVSLGLVRPGDAPSASVTLSDAGLGAGTWTVGLVTTSSPAGTSVPLPATVEVPGTLVLAPLIPAGAPEGDLGGWVTLTRGLDVRRIPFWLRVAIPRLGSARATLLRRPGLYSGDTRGRRAAVSTYRYPEPRAASGIPAPLDGPEQVFRLRLDRAATNFGVVVTSRSRGSRVQPRVVAAGDENRLTGYPGLPLNLNPYLAQFGEPVLAAGAIRPRAGAYDVVFDSPERASAGSFTFRYWLNDVAPPQVLLLTRRLRAGATVLLRVSDRGSGVDPATIVATVNGKARAAVLRGGVVSLPTEGLRAGRHVLRVQVSDYQESRNMENVPPILPNTRVLRTAIVIVSAP